MKLKSRDFNDYFFLPKTCGYRFGNKPPTLYAEDVPQNTATLALLTFDSDVIYGEKELTYWLAWNIPADIAELNPDSLPQGIVEGTNDMGSVGYAGPLLAREIHHVHFMLFALDVIITLDSAATRNVFDEAINGHFLDHASLTGMYQAE